MTNLSANGNGAASGSSDRPAPVASILNVAAGLTLLNGGYGLVGGLAHVQGVMRTAEVAGYPYEFRYAALVIVGLTIAYAGAVCLWGVRGLARGQRSAWGRALSGTLLLLLVSVPLIPVDGPGQDNAATTAIGAAVLLAILVAAWRRLEPGPLPR